MPSIEPNLEKLLKSYGEDGKSVWNCHGTWVAYHAAIERMCAKAGVVFDLPEIIHQDPKNGEVCIAVVGKMGDRVEWSFGEVSKANNKNSYPYAMAEKRAKDRVALKLLGMSGMVYSEEESDDFKVKADAPPKSSAALKKSDENGDDEWARMIKELYADFADCKSLVGLSKLRQDYRQKAIERRWNMPFKQALANEFDTFEESLKANDDTFPGDLPDGVKNMSVG